MTLPYVEPTPRNMHYGDFYSLTPSERDDRPVLLVHGNCQAESLRVLLELRYRGEIRCVRMVPAHEMTPDDVPHFMGWLARASYVVTQPIVADYRGLPIGTEQVRAATTARIAIVPVLRWAGLHPTQAIIRSAAGDPPIVPYHDLRVLAEAAGLGRPKLTLQSARALREYSLNQLTQRIQAHQAVDVADLFTKPGRRSVYVINHPTNEVLQGVATRVAEACGLPGVDEVYPGRVLLGSIIAPIEPEPAEIAGLLDVASGSQDASKPFQDGVWQVHGQPVAAETIIEAHLGWYAENPDAVAAGVARHRAALDTLMAGARA